MRLSSILLSTGMIMSACSSLPKHNVETFIDIPAPRTAVWKTLTTVEGYAKWNPFITKMEGTIAEGEILKNTMEPIPNKGRVFKPKILKVNQCRELRWLGRLFLPGIFDAEHYFILEDSPTGTKFTHGENFSGISLRFIDVQKFEKNFEQMNRALHDQVITEQKSRKIE